MRIGIFFPTIEQGSVDQMVDRVAAVEQAGFTSVWLPQSAGHDASTLLSVIGHQVPKIELGTSVVPTYPRHPLMLAAQLSQPIKPSAGACCLASGSPTRCRSNPDTGCPTTSRPATCANICRSCYRPCATARLISKARCSLAGARRRSQMRRLRPCCSLRSNPTCSSSPGRWQTGLSRGAQGG